MTSLPAELTTVTGQMRGTCPVGQALTSWPEGDVTWLTTTLADVKVPSDALSAAVAARTPRLASRDIANHRAGDCPCVIA